MFSIEHEFAASVITLVDEGAADLREDVVVKAWQDRVTVEQYDPDSDTTRCITLSVSQLRDLGAALDLPEGVYQIRAEEDGS